MTLVDDKLLHLTVLQSIAKKRRFFYDLLQHGEIKLFHDVWLPQKAMKSNVLSGFMTLSFFVFSVVLGAADLILLNLSSELTKNKNEKKYEIFWIL